MPTHQLFQLFVGIDVSKASHIAGFLSSSLLEKHKRFNVCPTLKFEQSRTGVDALLKRIKGYGPLSQCCVLLEQTGHYHRALEEALLEAGLAVYVVSIHQKKINGLDKTDKKDALRLANMLYSQVALGFQPPESTQRIERRLPPTPVAAELRPLVRLHYELTQSSIRIRNKLTAICDELFPEMTQILVDPNRTSALLLRERFPTPKLLVGASLPELQTIRQGGKRPGDKQLLELQQLAASSIGVKETYRQAGLVTEQTVWISSLRLINAHLAEIDAKIKELIDESREGQILQSIPGIGMLNAAFILAAIGNIRNFEKSSHLRRYFGWSPQDDQTGVSVNNSTLTKVGTRLMKRTIYLLTINAVKSEPWASLYQRLVERKCSYDPRLQKYRGKGKVIGRVAGQITTMVYAFLKRDASIVDATPTGEPLPEPELYDPAIHQAHRHHQVARSA